MRKWTQEQIALMYELVVDHLDRMDPEDEQGKGEYRELQDLLQKESEEGE